MAASPKPRKRSIAAFGLLLVALGSVALLWNEWRSAKAVETLRAAERVLVRADLERVPIEPSGQLVHVAGPARPSGPAADPLFAVRLAALRLDRIVEMQQWRETCEGSGNERDCRHARVWAEGRIASERFHQRLHQENPPPPPFASERFHPAEVGLGAFALAPELVERLPAEETAAAAAGAELVVMGTALEAAGAGFVSGDPVTPAIGDVRVRFRAVPVGEVSVIAGLDGSVLRPWTAPNGRSLALVEPGLEPAEALLARAYRGQALATWGLRLAGWLAVFVGTSLLLGRLVGVVPLLADLKARSDKAIALLLATAWSLVMVALAWLVFRPLVSLATLALATVVLLLVRVFRARRLADSLRARRSLED